MKKIAALVLTALMIFSLAACSGRAPGNIGEQTTVPVYTPSITAELSTPTSATSASPAATPSPSAAPTTTLVRAVVFDTTLNELSDYNKTDPHVQTVDDSLKMTLYETSPGVFEGGGLNTFCYIVKSDFLDTASTNYYRLDNIKLTPGGSADVEARNWYEVDSTEYDGTPWDSQLGSTEYTARFQEYVTVPFTASLTIDGDSAQFTLSGSGYETVYDGKCVTLPPPVPAVTLPPEKNISINTTARETGQPLNHEYRAMLTASPTGGGYGYAGNLFVYGDGGAIPPCDEAVTFSLDPFDQNTYQAAGGVFPGSYDAMGVIHASAGDYIVLMDGDRPMLEPAGQKLAFYGYMIADKDVAEAERVTDETKQLCKFLYDNTKNKGGNPDSIEGKPAWYPDWLMPKPIAQDAWYNTMIVNDRFANNYNNYEARYYDVGRYPADLLPNYKAQLNGYNSLEAILDENTDYGVIRFKQGAFTVRIFMEPTKYNFQPATTVTITILE